ncbi:hypothetical protein VP01_839g2 [Puccinia sorghi]|uniref:CMP/dCMP-type deaminase domain-containing protein n=1 Tax=Puccinia sorghi TaxID=27349 RepID=A0A0L6UA93_9BASI|nr:hypothetical protein VP01_839g2 [Puccinia sorghi]
MATREGADEHAARLREVVQILEEEEARRQGKGGEEREESFPFELVTQHSPQHEHGTTTTTTTTAETAGELTLPTNNHTDKLDIKHLKAIKPIITTLPPSDHDAPHGVSILLAKECSISYQDLTKKLSETAGLGELIERATPYRIRVPTKRAWYLQQMRGGGGEERETGWPMVSVDTQTMQQELETGAVRMSRRMLERRWTVGEVRWLLRQAQHVAMRALESQLHTDEMGVAAAVTRYSLDLPDEMVQPRVRPENTILATTCDLRRSSRNPLRHAVVELTSTVSAQDRLFPRLPESPLLPIPYLLTNQVVFLSHEPCLLCAMALLHSRIKHLFFLFPSPGSGGCGSVYNVHEQDGLNHRFFVWKLILPPHLKQRLKTAFFDP